MVLDITYMHIYIRVCVYIYIYICIYTLSYYITFIIYRSAFMGNQRRIRSAWSSGEDSEAPILNHMLVYQLWVLLSFLYFSFIYFCSLFYYIVIS